MEHIRKTDEIKISYEKYGDKECIVAEFEIPEPNRYMQFEKLWIDRSEIVPLRAEIYGNDGETYVEIFYDNFVYNPRLEDGDFEIIRKNSMKLQEMNKNVQSEGNQGRMGGSGSGCSCPQYEGNKEAC
ncbi:MAG TPA: hypothetical protein PL138_02375 [Bacillota bacterium]|nr:hypothetical protein [Bacillota bacterium]